MVPEGLEITFEQSVTDRVDRSTADVDQSTTRRRDQRRASTIGISRIVHQVRVELRQLVVDLIDLGASDLQLVLLVATDVEPTVVRSHLHRAGLVRCEDHRSEVRSEVRGAVHVPNADHGLHDQVLQLGSDLGVVQRLAGLDLVDEDDELVLHELGELRLQLLHPLGGHVLVAEERSEDVVHEQAFASALRALQYPCRAGAGLKLDNC